MERVNDSSSKSGHRDEESSRKRFNLRLMLDQRPGLLVGGLALLSITAVYLYRRWTREPRQDSATDGESGESEQVETKEISESGSHSSGVMDLAEIKGPKEFRDHFLHHHGEARTSAAIAAGAPASYFPMPGPYSVEMAKKFEEKVASELEIAFPLVQVEVPSRDDFMQFYDSFAATSRSIGELGDVSSTELVTALSTDERFLQHMVTRGIFSSLVLTLEEASLKHETMNRCSFEDILSHCYEGIHIERETCKRLLRILLKAWPRYIQKETNSTGQLVPPSQRVRERCLSSLLADRKLGPLLTRSSVPAGFYKVDDLQRSHSEAVSEPIMNRTESEHSRGFYLNESSPYVTFTRTASNESMNSNLSVFSLNTEQNEHSENKSAEDGQLEKLPDEELSGPLVLRLALLLAMSADQPNSQLASVTVEETQSEQNRAKILPSPASAFVSASLNLLTQTELARLELAKLIQTSRTLRTEPGEREEREEDWQHLQESAGISTGEADATSSFASSYVRVDHLSDDELDEGKVEQKNLEIIPSSNEEKKNAVTLSDRVQYLMSIINEGNQSFNLPLTLSFGSPETSFDLSDVIEKASAAIGGGWQSQLAALAKPLQKFMEGENTNYDVDRILDIERLNQEQESVFEKAVLARLQVLRERLKRD